MQRPTWKPRSVHVYSLPCARVYSTWQMHLMLYVLHWCSHLELICSRVHSKAISTNSQLECHKSTCIATVKLSSWCVQSISDCIWLVSVTILAQIWNYEVRFQDLPRVSFHSKFASVACQLKFASTSCLARGCHTYQLKLAQKLQQIVARSKGKDPTSMWSTWWKTQTNHRRRDPGEGGQWRMRRKRGQGRSVMK